MYTGIDRRIFERVNGRLVVRYKVVGLNEAPFYTTTVNISGGGVKVALEQHLEPGTVLELEIFRRNSNISAKCKGEIIWVSSKPGNLGETVFEAGVKFLDISFLYIGNLIYDLRAGSSSRNLLSPSPYC